MIQRSHISSRTVIPSRKFSVYQFLDCVSLSYRAYLEPQVFLALGKKLTHLMSCS